MDHPAVVAGAVAAGANLLGAVLVTGRTRWSRAALSVVVAFAAGFMLAVAIVDLLPEAIRAGGRAGAGGASAAAVALGAYLVVYLAQHVTGGHGHLHHGGSEITAAASTSAVAGLLLHAFFDGIAIASAFGASARLGVLVFVAILMHKVPEGLAVSSLELAAGASRARATSAAAALGASTLLGVAATGVAEWLTANGLALAAGVTLYVAASNLVPELQEGADWARPAALVSGAALYFVARAAVGV